MKKITAVLFLICLGMTGWAQKNSFDKTVGKTAINLEKGSFRFALGAESRNDLWGGDDYSSLIVPLQISLGITDNIEVDVGVEYSKPYSFVDGIAVDEKYSYHNLYGGIRLMMNPHEVHTKPAWGFWLGMTTPVHEYEVWKPEAIFLWSSYIGNVFSWNFNLGAAYYFGDSEYDHVYQGKPQTEVRKGMEISPKVEIGYIFSNFMKGITGFDVQIHFLGKRHFADGSTESIEDYSSFKWIGAVRFKPGDVPVIFDAGVRVGLNRKAEESFSLFFQIQLIPDSSDAVW